MKWLRYKLGVYLLRSVLFAEARLAQREHSKQEQQGPLERYWMGRFSAVHRILYGAAYDEQQ